MRTFDVSDAEEVMFWKPHMCDDHVKDLASYGVAFTNHIQSLSAQQHNLHMAQ